MHIINELQVSSLFLHTILNMSVNKERPHKFILTRGDNLSLQSVMKTNVIEKKEFGIDTQRTKVLLIGVSEYVEDETILDIPNIKQNIKLLKEVLLDENIMGIPKENIVVSLNNTKKIIERKLIKASREAEDENYTLLVYYSGHGILSSENFKLYLTSKESSKTYLESDSINIDRFREIIANSRAARKVVILDACHSGQIHNAMNDFTSTLNSEIKKFKGTYIMTSASEDKPSLFPHKNTNEPTYFTAKLIDVFRNGIDNSKPYISVREIFNEIYNCFKKQEGLPLPQQSIFKDADSILISKNVKYNGGEPAEEHFSYSNMRNTMIDKLQDSSNFLLEKKNFNFKKYIIMPIIAFSLVSIIILGAIFIKPQKNNQKTIAKRIIAQTDSIKNKKEIYIPVNQQAYEIVKEANKLQAKGLSHYNDALRFYIRANKLLKGSDKNIKKKISNLKNKINKIYLEYMKNAETYSKADDAVQEQLECLNNALIMKPKDSTALSKIKQIKLQ